MTPDKLLALVVGNQNVTEVVSLNLDFAAYDQEGIRPYTQLPDLQAFVNLEELVLSNHELESLHGLLKLKKLRFLDLSYNQLSTAEEAMELPQLQALNLNHNDIMLLPVGFDMPQLQLLSLSGNERLKSVDFLADMPNLKQLYLKQVRVPSLDALAELSKLEELYLSPMKPSSLLALKPLKELNLLHISSPMLTGLPAMPSLPKLQSLAVTRCPYLTDASPLRSLQTVEELNLSHNALTSADWVLELPNLRSLDLRGNPLEDTSRLKQLGEWVKVKWPEQSAV